MTEKLTPEQIELIRSCLVDGSYTPLEIKEFGALCDMALSSQREGWVKDENVVKVPLGLFLFLLGGGEVDGVSFGEKHPTIKGRYWWRRKLQELLPAAPQDEKGKV